MLTTGGRTVYGLALGVLMMDTKFPRALGDIGNALTWPFPVVYRVVRGAVPERLAQPSPDESLLEPFIEGVRELEEMGARAITTSCGFLAAHQRELAAAVSIPVFSSSLLQVPFAAQVIRPDQRVGIITARAVLSERHFSGAGFSADKTPVVQVAPAEDSHFTATFVGDALEADIDAIDREMGELTAKLMRDHPDVGAIILECANLAAFSQTVRRTSGVPVFDLYTMGMYAYLTSTGTDYAAVSRASLVSASS
jgi:Asp/Glu/Hydantoin racemase